MKKEPQWYAMETEVADEVLKKAVEDQGYQVENIQ